MTNPFSHKKHRIFDLAAPVLLGTVLFFLVCGLRVLNPTNIGWLIDGDAAQHYLGWAMYRLSPWHFPVGLSDWGLEVSSSVIYADALPLFAIPFKLLDCILPVAFQYYGLWYLTCFILSAVFGYRIAEDAGTPRWMRLVAALLVSLSPIAIWRMGGHQSLAGHWLILWALCLYLREKPSTAGWCFNLSATLAVHPYFTVMNLALFGADWVNRHLWNSVPKPRNEWLSSLASPALCAAVVLLTAWQVGYFTGTSDPTMDTGFGFYRANLNAFFNSMGASRLLPGLPAAGGDYEGFSYLGAGGLLLLIATGVLSLVRREDQTPLFRVTILPLTAAVFLLWIFSLSTNIGLGAKSWCLWQTQDVAWLQAFRSSGRFAWPLWYFLFLIGIATLARMMRAKLMTAQSAGVLLAVVAALQLADLSPQYLGMRRELMRPVKSFFFTHSAAFWSKVAPHYQKLRVLHNPGLGYESYRQVSSIAAQYRLKTNASFLSRMSPSALRAQHTKDDTVLANHDFAADTIYIIRQGDMAPLLINPPKNAAMVRTDGLNLLLPNWEESAGGALPSLANLLFVPQLGTVYPLNNGAAAQTAILQVGFSHIEPWGVWTEGTRAVLRFNLPENAKTLVLDLQPLVTPKHPMQRLTVKSHSGSTLWNGKLCAPNRIEIPLVGARHRTNVSDYADLTLELPDAATPKSLGINGDERMLGIGLRSFTVK